MVNKITFPETGKGYIYKILEKPEPPLKPYKDINGSVYYIATAGRRIHNDDSEVTYDKAMVLYNEALARYKEDIKYYKKHKNDYMLNCSYNLVGKTITFEPEKINVIFGKNGSGKTTILKAIAGNAQIKDGFSTLYDPFYVSPSLGEEPTEQSILECRQKNMKNSAIVDWDGIPIYYNNFETTLKNAGSSFGEMQGSIINSGMDEIEYVIFSNIASGGEHTRYVFNKIMNIVKDEKSLKDILSKYIEIVNKHSYNTSWETAYKKQLEVFEKLEKYYEKGPITLLFDEIDKSLDILTSYNLYAKILPEIVEQSKCQIILVSHNPIILSKQIRENSLYNIIDLSNDNYLRHSIEKLQQIEF